MAVTLQLHSVFTGSVTRAVTIAHLVHIVKVDLLLAVGKPLDFEGIPRKFEIGLKAFLDLVLLIAANDECGPRVRRTIVSSGRKRDQFRGKTLRRIVGHKDDDFGGRAISEPRGIPTFRQLGTDRDRYPKNTERNERQDDYVNE